VLKGPNAAALYGNRAANGAIVITTKKGTARKGIGVNVSSDLQFQDLLVLPDYQNEYGGGAGPFGRNAQGQDVVRFAVDESWGPRLDGRPVRQWYSYDPTIPEFFGQTTPGWRSPTTCATSTRWASKTPIRSPSTAATKKGRSGSATPT
jgi:TonB-dependent SusC/RagA subfamily outer membrane receptor